MKYFANTLGYIGQYLWDILGIYRAKTMGYIVQKLRDILAKERDIFCKTMGYIGQTLWDIFKKRNIFGKNFRK